MKDIEKKENRIIIFSQKKFGGEMNYKIDSKKDYNNKKSGKNKKYNITYFNMDENYNNSEEESLGETTKFNLEKKGKNYICGSSRSKIYCF